MKIVKKQLLFTTFLKNCTRKYIQFSNKVSYMNIVNTKFLKMTDVLFVENVIKLFNFK